MSVVELFRRATAQPRLCGLKARSWFIKSELSIRARSAKWRSQYICNIKKVNKILPAYMIEGRNCLLVIGVPKLQAIGLTVFL